MMLPSYLAQAPTIQCLDLWVITKMGEEGGLNNPQVTSRGSPGGDHSASTGCHLMSQSKSSFPKAHRPLLHKTLPYGDCDA